jgi:corrinoid protein of di/trimethylamine methyltransferase
MTEAEILKQLYEAVIQGNAAATRTAANQGLEQGMSPLIMIEQGMTTGIKEVGDRFGVGEMFLPEMVSSAEAMEAGLQVLEPHLGQAQGPKKNRILIGTVQGDIHDIGKNIVIALLKVNGFEVIDIGRDVPSTQFVDKAVDLDVSIIGLSGLLTTSMPMMRDVVQMLEQDGVRNRFKVMIGGGPTSQAYADQIRADGYGETAFSAVSLSNQLLQNR